MPWDPFSMPIVDPASLDWTFPAGYRLSGFGECRSCNAPIAWLESERTGKRSPWNPEGTSHFASCPNAAAWRDWSAKKARKAGA